MTHRSRPRVHLLTGGPDWEQRQTAVKSVPFTKRQKEARKPLLALTMTCAKPSREVTGPPPARPGQRPGAS